MNMDIENEFESLFEHPGEPQQNSLWFVFRGREILTVRAEDKNRLPTASERDELPASVVRPQYLGRWRGRDCFTGRLKDEDSLPQGWSLIGLREFARTVPDGLGAVAGRAAQALDWDQNHRYCGRCGVEMALLGHERAKECPSCGLLNYPRISPAVIMLVYREGEVLLARGPRHRKGMYSVLAGFVEPGERLEAAVAREVFEETSIRVKDIRYFGNQPWPFPDSLMIGYTCAYESGEIDIDTNELADAKWFTADDLPLLPGPASISRQMIDWYLKRD